MTLLFDMTDDSSFNFKVKFIFKGFDNSDVIEQMINIPKQLSCVLRGRKEYIKHTSLNFKYIYDNYTYRHVNIFKSECFLKLENTQICSKMLFLDYKLSLCLLICLVKFLINFSPK